ncbi:hypothetical protein AgCh_017277 [Apium graveolens]
MLDFLTSLKEDNSKLHTALGSTKTSRDYYKGLVEGVEKKVEEEREKHKKEIKSENKDQELSQAYSLGFKAYLKNFLAVNPDYDWSTRFPPSTPRYKVKFKADNAATIEQARVGLQAKIEVELAVAEIEKAKKMEGEKNGGNAEDSTMASPSNTIVS